MRIVLHIGLHKTGTTSLQHILKTRFSTLTPNGIWYPPTDPGGPGHAVIAHEFFGFSGGPPNPAALLQHVEKAEREGVDTLVLSSEDFFYAKPEQIPLLADALKRHDVDLFLTMSPLLRRAVSLWQESVKHGDPTPLPDALPHLMDQARYALTVFETFIECLRPKNAHVVIVNTKASPFKLIRDFWRAANLGTIRFKEEDNIGVQLNRSFNMMETALLRCINHLQRQNIDEQNPNYLLHGAPAIGTYLINAAFLTPAWRELCPKKPIEAPENWRFVFHELAQENIAKLKAFKNNYGLFIAGDMKTLALGTEPKGPAREDKDDDHTGHRLQCTPDIPSVIDIPVISLEKEDWGASMSRFEANRTLSESTSEKGSLVLHAGVIDLPAKPISLRTLFVQPAYPEHSPWLEYIPFAFWLMDAHRPRLFVQLGVGRGTSYFAFCQSVQRLGLNTRCYGVDSWTSADAADTAQKDAFRTVASYNNSEYAHFSTILQSDVGKALDHFQDSSIGLLNIDIQGDSSTTAENIENWITKLSDKAIALVHGINTCPPNSELSKTINNLKTTYKHFEFSYGDGLIAFAIGEGYGDHINFIFQSQGYDASISEIFYRIGRACYDSVKVSSLTEQLDALELERSRQHALIEALSADQGKHQSILEDRLRELGWFKHALEKSNLDRDQRQTELEKAQAQIAELEAERDHLSVEAEQAVSALKERVAQAEAEAKSARQELEQAQATAQEQQARFQAERGQLADQLAERDRTVAALGEEAEAERKAHAAALNAAETRLAALDADLREAQKRAAEAQGHAEKVEAERGQLAGQLAERDRTVAALGEEAEAERKAHAAALNAAETRLAALDADLREAQKRAAEAEAERSHAQAEASHMGTMLQVRYREITDLVQALETERNQHGAERSELKAQVNSLETTLQATRQALSDAQGQSVASAAKHAELEAECNRLAGLLEDRDRAAAALVQQVAGEQAQTETVREALRDAQARAAAAKAEESALREENGRITGKLQSQQSELAALTQEIETARAKHAAELAVLTELLEQNGVSENGRRSALLAMTLGIIKSMCAHATSIPDNTEAIRHISHTLAASGAFDPEWYRSTYEDVAASDMDPLLHFIAYGFNEGRLPSQSFA